ncbi:MAG: hypothetical protein N3B10_13970 [Armatimonadetes bacterium]|nr:hypothetical protein [Armatimonadota bacterium]
MKIQAKQLGWLKMGDFCPRCLWLMLKHPLPDNSVYNSPPARIFRQFENFVQRSISQVMQQTKRLPSWLSSALETSFPSMPNVQEVCTQKTLSMRVGDAELIGRADILCRLDDGTFFIGDFKLSQPSERYTPFYETQLNAYAFLTRRQLNLKVSRLALIYFELDEQSIAMPSIVGIMAPIKCIVQPVTVWSDDEVIMLLKQMVNLLSLDQPPEPSSNCCRCRQDLAQWAQMLVDWLVVES